MRAIQIPQREAMKYFLKIKRWSCHMWCTKYHYYKILLVIFIKPNLETKLYHRYACIGELYGCVRLRTAHSFMHLLWWPMNKTYLRKKLFFLFIFYSFLSFGKDDINCTKMTYFTLSLKQFQFKKNERKYIQYQ